MRIKNYFKNSIVSETGRMWAVILMEQFRDHKAGALIIEENKRMAENNTMILKLMIRKGLIKKTDPEMLASELTYVIRALHYEFIIRHTFGMDTAPSLKKVMEHIDFFFSKRK